jgi:hypothetical protein
VEDMDGAEEVGIVGQGLAHSHEDDVIDTFLAFAQEAIEKEDLLNDAVGREVLLEPKDAAGAELTTDGASDLGADAGGTTWAVGYHDGFRGGAPFPAGEDFLSAVAADLVLDEGGDGQVDGFGKFGAIGLREIGHLRRIVREFLVNPLADLSPAIDRPAQLNKDFVRFLWQEAEKICQLGNLHRGLHIMSYRKATATCPSR